MDKQKFTCQQCGYKAEIETVFKFEVCPKCNGNLFPDDYVKESDHKTISANLEMKGMTIKLTEDQYDRLDSIRYECLHADLPGIIIGQFYGHQAVVNFISFEKALMVIRALDPEKYKKAIEYVEEEFGVQVILRNKESEEE